MANIKSQKKRIRTNEKAHIRNKACRSELKTAIKRVRQAVDAKDVELAQKKCAYACKLLDKAHGRGIICKNQAANRKSGIQKLVNTLGPLPKASEPKAEKPVEEKPAAKKPTAKKEPAKKTTSAAKKPAAKKSGSTTKKPASKTSDK